MAEPVYDPDYADRMSRRLRAEQHSSGNDYSDHYAEKAQAREDAAHQRALYRANEKRNDPVKKAVMEWEWEQSGHYPTRPIYDESDPRWTSREEWESDYAEFEEKRDRFEAKLVGPAIADKILRRQFRS